MKTLVIIYALLIGAATMAFLNYLIFLAWLTGNWTITLYFNRFGEGPFELVIFPILLAIAILANVYFNKGAA